MDAKKTQAYAEWGHTFKKNSGCNEIISVDTQVRDKKRLVKVGNLVKNSYLYR